MRRIERLIAAEDYETAMIEECMHGVSYYPSSPLHNRSDRWEQCELTRMNATRCVDRICFTLPLSAYEQKRCAKYAERGHHPSTMSVRTDDSPRSTFPMAIPGYDVAEDDYSEDSLP